jgi:hypothetical protein
MDCAASYGQLVHVRKMECLSAPSTIAECHRKKMTIVIDILHPNPGAYCSPLIPHARIHDFDRGCDPS